MTSADTECDVSAAESPWSLCVSLDILQLVNAKCKGIEKSEKNSNGRSFESGVFNR